MQMKRTMADLKREEKIANVIRNERRRQWKLQATRAKMEADDER